ncbi:MAG: hypothetical protein F7C35_01480 [Desulfurococcales archaeon]|nr:hypothetical protein [Desulfurococcales archaeon]
MSEGSGVKIKLLDPEMLGRRFQYAFISFSERAYIRPSEGEVEFGSVDDFLDAVEEALKAILDGLTWPVSSNRRQKCSDLTVQVAGYSIVCNRLDRGPRLYQLGSKSDFAIIRNAQLDLCKYVTQKCDKTVAWTHAAVSYALKVLEMEGPLNGPPEYEIPWLARATLFSKVRSVRGTVDAKGKLIDVDTLGTILLGGALSYLGSQRLDAGGRGQASEVEFYILPDYPSKEYRVLRQISAAEGITGNIAARTVRLLRELTVSFEQALALSIAVAVYRHAGIAQKAGVNIDAALSSGKLYSVQPGQRAQVRVGLPLTNVLLHSYERGTINSLEWFIDEALRQKDKEARNAAKNAASTCLNSLFLQAVSGASGDLYLRDCARDLVAVYNYDKAGNRLKEAARSLLGRLEWEAVRFLHSMR